MTPALDLAIRELLCVCFPGARATFTATRGWHGSAPAYSIVYTEGERALAHVGVVVREISCDGRPVKVAGVQNVAVHHERRSTRFSWQVMRAAMEEAARRGIPYGLLFCVPALERFYRFLGWEKVEVRVTMLEATGDDVPAGDRNITMVKDLIGTPLRPAEMHLLGRDW